jgi:hypothetical protein
MAEIISFAEIQAARRRTRAPERENLERALQVLRDNLAAAAQMLADAPRAEQPELLRRVERLTSLVRYAMRMLGAAEAAIEKPALSR